MFKNKKILLIFIFIFLQKNYIYTQTTNKNSNKQEIIFGQSLDLSGPFKLYGQIIKDSISACFENINQTGGINGKILKLITLDDHAEPEKAEQNIKKLLSENKIDLFLGNMGTRNIFKILPLIKEGKIALFFPWAGDEKLRDPKLKYLINGPGYTKPQIDFLINYILNNLGYKKIAIFHADSDFSIADKNYTLKKLSENNIEHVSIAEYNRYTMDLEKATSKLIEADPKVIICLSTDKPTAKLISNFFEKGYFGTIFIGLDSTSFVPQILKDKGAKFLYTTSMPNFNDIKLNIIKEYQKSLSNLFPEQTFNSLSLTYYICAKILVQAIKNIKNKDITKEEIIKSIENFKNYNLDGFLINFNSSTRNVFGQNISIIG